MFRWEQQKVPIMSLFSSFDLVIITDFINPVGKPDKQMSSSITYNVGGMSTCQENIVFLIIVFFYFLIPFFIFITFIFDYCH